MKTEEDEAFDDIARKQGMWGGGFQAKRAMAANKWQEPVLIDYARPCMDAEKALKDAHWAVLENKYELAISKTLEAIESATLMHAALIEMSREH